MSISREDAIALVRRLQDAVNAHDARRVADFYADDAVMVSPVLTEVRGRSAIADSFETVFSTFPDWTVEVMDVLVDGARMVTFGTVTATDRIGWFGLPATGERIRYRAMLVWTVEDGQIVRDERIYDLTDVWALLEKARVDRELRMAAEVQRALLSRTAHVGRYWQAVGDSVPCRAIGGDFFGFVECPASQFGQ